ncbi:MAG TPA: hypothetical protein VJ997_00040 [Longimicrobiales bacterium]|nr:hypothetical protein [Longimicrobiales bacterium]
MSRVRVLLIVGANRSGTTLVGRLAGVLPGTFFGGELAQVWSRGLVGNELCGCGEPFHRCPVWADVRRGLRDRVPTLDPPRIVDVQSRVDRLRNVPRLALGVHPGDPGGYEAWMEGVRALYLTLADVTGADVLVDSSKRLSYALMVAGVPDVDLTVLLVTRDPRAVAFSKTRRRRRPEIVDKEVHMGTRPPWRSALNWTAVHALYGAVGHRFGRRATLRYEDVVTDPEASLGRLGDLVGATRIPTLQDPREIELGPSHSVSGNPMRLRTGKTPLVLDDEWTGAMPTRDRIVVTALTGPLLPWFGYPPWGGPRSAPRA